MTDTTDAGIRRIHEQWHDAVVSRDVAGLARLYADDAVFESPLVWVTAAAGSDGILRGKDAIAEFFAAGFKAPENGLGRWYRTGTFLSNGQLLTWEYPRDTPHGDQVDLVEVMDVHDGLIAHHRVYWGWVGFKTLAGSLKQPA
jgi:hypothetical protein